MSENKTLSALLGSIQYEIAVIQDATRDGDNPKAKKRAIRLMTALEGELEDISADIINDEAE